VCSLIAPRIVTAACATVTAMIRPLDPARDADACDAIVRGLPDWFGVAEGIEECAAAVRSHDGLVAMYGSGVSGFLTYERRTSTWWEITWMAIRADRHRSGVGTCLVDELIGRLPDDAQALLVRTLSDRDGDPGPEYAATRAFYLARGFAPVAELDLWGPENPCQLLARRMRPDGRLTVGE
jgi:GNAT superfamily N-acetyltransferase